MIIVFTDNQIMDASDSFSESCILFTGVLCIYSRTYKQRCGINVIKNNLYVIFIHPSILEFNRGYLKECVLCYAEVVNLVEK